MSSYTFQHKGYCYLVVYKTGQPLETLVKEDLHYNRGHYQEIGEIVLDSEDDNILDFQFPDFIVKNINEFSYYYNSDVNCPIFSRKYYRPYLLYRKPSS